MFQIVAPESVGLSSDRLRRVSDWMQSQVDRRRLPGLSVLVHRRGRTAYFETAGQMDVEAGKPVAADTIFRIFSMTKPITSVAAMMLYEEGRFQLDDPLGKFLPEFADMKAWSGKDATAIELMPAREPITPRHLLTH
ncbi:MAG TPA: serine hydrolase domain-containing protein, partial [Alphaproteobacteria bacterium]|nr:serine hydrolase domain-containing protein [Alphaproteobacteria bacterium]